MKILARNLFIYKLILGFIFILTLSNSSLRGDDQIQSAFPFTGQSENLQTTVQQHNDVQQNVFVETEQQVFGFDVFSSERTEGDEFGALVLPPNYTLGPGDRIGIYLLGSEPINFDVVVNVEGKVFIPSVGVLTVAGITLGKFRRLLNRKIAKFYANYEMDLMLLSPKYIRIAVVGDVKQPGNYNISALSTVLDAVIKAGGPTKRGSLRNIQLFRKKKLIAYYDLYTFLMKGESQEQVLLQTGDRIFIPFMEAKVKVTGEIRRPAFFELKCNKNETIQDIFELAGGFTEFAYLNQIEISRLNEDGERTLSYINFNQILSDSNRSGPILQNQDWIKVYSILEQKHTTIVSIFGEIKKPGKYRWQNNMRISDLILMAGNLTRSAYTLTAEVAKVDPLKPSRVRKFELDKILADRNSPQNILLQDDDLVFIRKIPKWEIGLMVQVSGEVQFPGTYSINRDSTKLSTLFAQTGGFTKDALIREAIVIRKSSKIFIDKEYERLKSMPRDQMSESEYQYLVMKQNMQDVGQVLVDFHKLIIEGDKSEDIILENGDIIRVPRAPVVVQVTGRVSRPGGVLFRKGKKLKYYFKKAGGTTWDADVRNTKITKVTGEIVDYDDAGEFMPGDIIWVPRKPQRDWWTIFRDTSAIMAQLATVYLIIQNVRKN